MTHTRLSFPQRGRAHDSFLSRQAKVLSDHLPVLRHLDVTRPPQQDIFQTTRNNRAINRHVFKVDVAASITALDRSTADQLNDQLNDQLHTLLDRQAPATQRKVPRTRPSPWYNAVASQLRAF